MGFQHFQYLERPHVRRRRRFQRRQTRGSAFVHRQRQQPHLARQTATSSAWQGAIATGTSFTSQSRTISDSNLTNVQVADLNGDGAADLFGISNSNYRAQLSTTSGGSYTLFTSTAWGAGAPAN